MKKARLPLILAATLFTAAGAYAGTNISGSVYNKNTSEPIDYATVALVNPETGVQLPIGTLTDENGAFVITDAPPGKYILRVSMMGSVPQEREVTVTDSGIDIGRIELSDDTRMLQEVVVKGKKSQMTLNSERRVFNVSSNISSSGASADELLASVPSVTVNNDGEISLRGNSDVLVWIDGKEMGMNADNRAQILSQIPAETIESIEVMTNPSSRHSTEGTAGIINIKLKSDSRRGYFGSAAADIDTHGTANLNLSFNYNTEKFDSFAALGLKTRHQPGGSTSDRLYDSGHFLKSEADKKMHENSMFLRLGTNFKPNARNTFYLSGIGTLGHKWSHTTTLHRSNLPAQWISNKNQMRESGDTRGANILLGYTHTF